MVPVYSFTILQKIISRSRRYWTTRLDVYFRWFEGRKLNLGSYPMIGLFFFCLSFIVCEVYRYSLRKSHVKFYNDWWARNNEKRKTINVKLLKSTRPPTAPTPPLPTPVLSGILYDRKQSTGPLLPFPQLVPIAIDINRLHYHHWKKISGKK